MCVAEIRHVCFVVVVFLFLHKCKTAFAPGIFFSLFLLLFFFVLLTECQ